MQFQPLPSSTEDPRWNLNKKSLAVIAVPDDESQGVVVWYVGGHIDKEIEENGRFLEDLDLYPDDGQTGFFVWEGTYKRQTTPDGELETVAFGEFREPTEEEWLYIMKNVCPWDERDWYIH